MLEINNLEEDGVLWGFSLFDFVLAHSFADSSEYSARFIALGHVLRSHIMVGSVQGRARLPNSCCLEARGSLMSSRPPGLHSKIVSQRNKLENKQQLKTTEQTEKYLCIG